jgi:hypothetical protein
MIIIIRQLGRKMAKLSRNLAQQTLRRSSLWVYEALEEKNASTLGPHWGGIPTIGWCPANKREQADFLTNDMADTVDELKKQLKSLEQKVSSLQ